jgi:protein-L-isoaspartate(D-aspartate) O-methyltransferase
MLNPARNMNAPQMIKDSEGYKSMDVNKKPGPDQGNPDATSLNQALVDDLKKRDLIKSPRVEAAFRSVPRHLFLPGVPLEQVYSDRAISAKQDPDGKWISSSSQPAIMAIMLEQLGLEPGHKVLEIGTGPGYNAALMAHIVGDTGQVVTVEIDEDLTQSAREHLAAAGFERVQAICADGGYGVPDAAPFDRIILTVGAPDITPAWWNQLKPQGRLVLPLLLRGSMKSIAFEQAGDHLQSLSVTDCGFISLRGDFASTQTSQIQLGPEPGLYLEFMDRISMDGNAVYGLLTGPKKDWAAGVDCIAWDVLGGHLWTWLALHDPDIHRLVAEGEMVGKDIVPPVLGIDARQKSSATAILIMETGLAALMRPPGQSLPIITLDQGFLPDSPATQPFPLYIRQFGSDRSVTERLAAQVRAWKAAGSPPSEAMQIRVYRGDSDYQPVKDEMVLAKQWTKLILNWPGTAE